MPTRLLALAAISGLIAVAMGAFGAHGLRHRLPDELMSAYQTAVQYQFWHTLALFGTAIHMTNNPSRWLLASGGLFAAGIFLFCGSLYVLALSGIHWLGAVTPIGGFCWLAGWSCLARACLRRSS